MTFKFITATDKDWQILLELEQEASSKYYHAYTEKEDIEKYLKSSNIFMLKADDGKIIGSISYEDKGSQKAYFDGLIVRKSLRGQGIASQAMDTLFSKLVDQGFESIDLLTHPHNSAALRLYLRMGFVIQEWIDNPFGDGEPRLTMIKKFSN